MAVMTTGNKVGRMVYLDYETDQFIQTMKKQQTSTSSFCAMIIEEALGIKR